MARPKGSKNKPKVTKALVGEVINKPVKSPVKSTEAPEKELTPDFEPSTNVDTIISEMRDPVPVLSDEEVNAAALKEAQHTVTRRRKLSIKDKSFQDQLDFIFADLKGIRQYVGRLEDALNVRRNELTNEPEPVILHKRKRKNNVELDNNAKQENDPPTSV